MVCGWVIQYFTESLQWDFIRAYRAIYFGYAIIGLLKFVLIVTLSHSVESEKKQKQRVQDRDDETRPLLGEIIATSPPPKPKRRLCALFPDISKESVPVVITLCLLFALDSFGSGLAPLSWITYYFKYQFDIEEGKLGSIFFVTQMIAAVSMLVASSLAKRFGNVNVCLLSSVF